MHIFFIVKNPENPCKINGFGAFNLPEMAFPL
jgi:hypothetical protein